MTDAIKRAGEELYAYYTVGPRYSSSAIRPEVGDWYDTAARTALTAALDDREGMARVLYEDEHGSLPDDVWESLTAVGYSEKSPIGRAFRRIDALRAHLLGGEA